MKGRSIFSLMVGFVICGAGSESVLAQTTIAVPARKFCVDSGINVSRGDSLQFSASGQGSYGYEGSPVNSTPLTNPDGDRFVNGVNIGKKDDPNAIYKGFIGGLVGKVGANGNYFFIGSNNQLSMGQSGRLFLCYNDVANSFNNNTGGYKVSINRISDPNQQNAAGRDPSPSQQTQTGRDPQFSQNINQFNRFEIGKLSTGERVLRVPKQYMQQTPFREALQRPIRPSSAREYTMRNDDYGVFLWDGKRLQFTSYTVYKITDFQVGDKTYWLTETSDITGFGNLEISKPYFLDSKIAFSGESGGISIMGRQKNNSAIFIIKVVEGNGWNLPITHYSLDLSNPNKPVVSPLVILQKKGILQDGDPINYSDGSLYNSYTFQGYADQSITINLDTRSFSSYLVLIAPDGKKIADNRGTQRNPIVEITVTLPSTGTYKVVVNGRDRTDPQGRYILNVNSNQIIATGRSPSPSQQTTTGRSPASNPQGALNRSPAPSRELPPSTERSLLVVANPQSIRGVNVPPADKSPNQLLNGYGFILDKPNAIKLNDGTAVYSIDVYNTGYADGVVEVYDARNNLIEVRGITGIRNPATNLYGFPLEGANRLFKLLTEGYGFTDPRNAIGRSQKTEIRNIAIPPGGRMIFTKNGERSLRYNQATFVIGVLSDIVLPKVFDGDKLTFKSKLLLSLYAEIQKDRVGSLVKDGMFLTLEDSKKAFVNQSWIDEQNLSYLMATGSNVLAQELANSGVETTVINQLVLGRKLNFWVTAAETFAQGSNIFLQWLDLDRSQKWEQQDGQPFGIANNK